MNDEPGRIGVLFVCMGNICRSPLAEGLFIHQAREREALHRFEVDSCGTGGWHAGNPADPRSIAVARRHGVVLPSRARQVDAALDWRFDRIVAMDRSNRDDLLALGAPRERVSLMLSWDPSLEGEHDVPDPYYGGADGFDGVYDMLERACAGLLDALRVE
ncbi:MAG: low molecular weight protein-tyrosine-phosphatase [Planctomycetota bacterium]